MTQTTGKILGWIVGTALAIGFVVVMGQLAVRPAMLAMVPGRAGRRPASPTSSSTSSPA